ncbi:AraC family transcriptional regulator [Paenibacillus sp. FSL L8-0436]|uniref:helix-turn-helix transcriptional regulator n=1 Tax=unclassified Paenibacillus TaxID=185978 RepID=UPI0004F6CA66|nr:AraC family transcriptional regulator [Paenibacillus sp. FSL H7-0357]AIQ19760.1 AraC family transcriptional regulator [Paenibacillus sp. FSL H7-0357]
MDTSLLICDHSYHYKSFNHNLKGGLQNYLFRLQTEGSCEVTSHGKEYTLSGGDLLLLRPGDDYQLTVKEPDHKGRLSSGDYYLFCEGPWIDAWWKRRNRPVANRIGLDDKLIGLWRNLLLEKRRGSLEEDTELKDVLLRSLCLYIDRAITENVQADRKGTATLKLKRFIEEHATVTFKLEEAAGYAGLSLSRAVRLFKEHYGKTMIQYAIEIRLKAAVEQIKYSELTLEHIAETCGFASYSYFHRVFRAHFGVSPLEYRLK